MSNWRAKADDALRGWDIRDNSANRSAGLPETGANVPIVPIVPIQPARVLRKWHAHLSRLDPDQPPDGCNAWWRQAVEDSCWLYENYASRAVRDGWSAHDLWGVMLAHPGWGGLTDRLRGARDLKMDSDRAAWTVGGVRERFCRGGGDDLRADLVLIWEVSR
jgi:hypothetical protein